MPELKPFPFCGAKSPVLVVDDETEEMFGVCCFGCAAQIAAVFDSEDSAIEAWNRRVNDA